MLYIFIVSADRVNCSMSSKPDSLMQKCLQTSTTKLWTGRMRQMGFHFKMQLLFEELHKGILPLTRGEKKTLPFKANRGMKVNMNERKMGI